MEQQAAKPEENSYQIISFPGERLPETYRPVLLSRWLRGLRFGNDFFRLIDSDAYYAYYQRYIESILKKPDTIVKFAVLTDDHETVLGYSVIEKDTLHWVHVQKEFRHQGIARSLVSEPIKRITNLTHTGITIWNNKLKKVVFNPFG